MAAKLTMYTAEGCHLCEKAHKEILAASKIIKFDLTIIDIQNEYLTYEKYKDDIPVIALNGEEIARHKTTADFIVQKVSEYLSKTASGRKKSDK